MADKKEKKRALAKSAELGGPVPLGDRDINGFTPLQKQYFEIKNANQDKLLFFRLGDFYELFDEDAVIASRELDLMLTTRDRNKPASEQVPMCGVPYHSADTYIARLLQKGYKIAICEQLEDPAKAKGLVKRGVVRVITPGMVLDGAMLDSDTPNFLGAVYLGEDAAGVAFCDLSSGDLRVADCARPFRQHICDALACSRPREVIVNDGALADKILMDYIEKRLVCVVTRADDYYDFEAARQRAHDQFDIQNTEVYDRTMGRGALMALGTLLRYIDDTQKGCDLSHVVGALVITSRMFMDLDLAARESLELTQNMRTGEKRGSLFWVLDRTMTPMGARTLRAWVELPLLGIKEIHARLLAVKELVEDTALRQEMREVLGSMCDIPRMASRTVNQTANARDLLALADTFSKLPAIRDRLKQCKCGQLLYLSELDTLQDVVELVDSAIAPNAKVGISDGDIIKPGFNKEVDRLRGLRDNSALMVADLERREQERTGIKKLKIGYNRVFGYYIDLPANIPAEQLPEDYVRKQTLATHERYFTLELKALEAELSAARENVSHLEYVLFCETRAKIARTLRRIQDDSMRVAALDALASMAEVAVRNNYVCPEVDDGPVIDIRGGRHPVVERMQRLSRFVPNDTHLDAENDRLAVITGPNMAGKSTYLRQTALIVLMAQIGSFVPAQSATIGIADRIFTRIGASDDLGSGQSTFMVEMSEVANILKSATKESLILLDEIGRGTSTYDGVAIARAVLEYCAGKKTLGARTMLATHYHELTELEGRIDGVRNYCSTARKQGDSVVFLRHIARGAADDSYGIEVASLAGVPESVVKRAKECLAELTSGERAAPAAPEPGVEDERQLTIGEGSVHEVLTRLRGARLETLSPIEAMNLLYELQRKLDP